MAIINPYLNFGGSAEEAFNFYKSVFGGEFTALQRFRDTPGGDQLPAADGEKILHISLPLGRENILMGSDMMRKDLKAGNNVFLSLQAQSKEEADDLFRALSADGGVVTMPMGDAFWGGYFGMLVDKFGVQWMIGYDYEKQ